MAPNLPLTHAEAFTLPFGSSQRTLAYNVYGASNANAPKILYFHGYPSTHVEARLFHPFAVEQGVRLLAITRPGYGESTYVPNRKLLDWPQDVLALVDHLGIEKFGVLGVSGGGPYVFACLHAIPRERLLAAGVVCGLFPSELGLAGMNVKHRLMINASVWTPGLFAWLLRGAFEAIRAKDAEGDGGKAVEAFLSAEMKNLPFEDQKVWNADENGFRTAMVDACRLMVRNPHAADTTAQEAGMFGRHWGFDFAGLNVEGQLKGRLMLWHGTEDLNIPCRLAREVVALLEGSVELRVSNGEGHGSLAARKAEEAIDWVAGRTKEK